MKNLKNQKGITLIALIITIIVMLILVGVTINIALNGGLFEKAKSASVQTQREIEREQLISIMLGAYNSRGKFVIGDVGTLPDGAKWCNKADTDWNSATGITPTGNGDWVITKNNNKFYIDEYGNVLDEMPDEDLDIWQTRGLDISKVIIGKQYEFNAITYEGHEYNFKITLKADGSLSWDNGYNTEDGDIPTEVVTDYMNSYVLCNNSTLSLMDGDIPAYITIDFNGDTATAYIAETLGGTSETYYVTTKEEEEIKYDKWYKVTFKNIDKNKLDQIWEQRNLGNSIGYQNGATDTGDTANYNEFYAISIQRIEDNGEYKYGIFVLANGTSYNYNFDTNRWTYSNGGADYGDEIIATRVKFVSKSNFTDLFELDDLAELIKIEEVQ